MLRKNHMMSSAVNTGLRSLLLMLKTLSASAIRLKKLSHIFAKIRKKVYQLRMHQSS
jgi:hypothetical protein